MESTPAKKSKPLLSPLRYPGSKRKQVPKIKTILELHNLKPKLFVEPFAGGASIALQLLNDNMVDSIGLADSDPLVASFWHSVFFDTDWLLQAVVDIEVTIDNWQRLKNATPTNDRERALHCLFFNRTNFSGIITREAGPLGGKGQQSQYDIGCRFPKTTIIKR